MPFTKLKLTTFGSTLETKWKQGKGVHFTRIALGDGLLGNGSMINRTSLVSERLSLQIDGIVASDDATQAAVVATLNNRDITEGFPYRELALMAKDPDTGREGTYLYDNAGQECEYLDTQANGVLIYERLKMLIRVEQAETISFEASGNPLNITWTDIEPILAKKADLGEDGTVVASQLPEMNYESPLKDNAAKDTPADGDSLPLVDSADSSKTKRVLWSRVKAVLKGYFDSLYAAASHSHAWSAITGKPSSFAPAAHASTHGSGGTDPVTPAAIGAAAAGPGTSTVGPLHRIGCPLSRSPRAAPARPPPPRRSTPSSTAPLRWPIPGLPQATSSRSLTPPPRPGRRSRSKISSITCRSSAVSPRSPPAPTLAQAPMGPITRAV